MGNIRIQAQGVDLLINFIQAQTNTRQSNFCCGPGPRVDGTGGCSRCTSAFAAAYLFLTISVVCDPLSRLVQSCRS